MSGTAITAGLLAGNAVCCKPPLPAAEVGAIARSVARYAPGERGPMVVLDDVEPLVDRRHARQAR
jgi:hypothetical protein